ncbi:MAG: 6-bladed beta-propeller, partial [Gammaproteobacteria bacterium]|nr:6-bladed beta-propeller [Gammaproteobacteria bacterium]
PQPPETARIEYLGSFSSPEDLGITKSFWQRLGEFFTGVEQNNLIRPTAIITTRDGKYVFVTDPGAKGVHQFDLDHGKYRIIRRKNNMPLLSPIGITTGPDNHIYITDSALNQVYAINPDSKYAVPVTLDGELKQPTGITYDEKTNRLYIVNTAAHHIKVFSGNGKFINQFGKHGNGAGQFNYPTFIWQDNQRRLLVTDSLNFRIQLMNADGKMLGKFGKVGDATGNLSRPKGVATDNQGHIYIVDALFHAFQIFDSNGQLLLDLGSQGQKPGEFWLPTGIFITQDNTIYIADSHNKRVQQFRYIGGRP